MDPGRRNLQLMLLYLACLFTCCVAPQCFECNQNDKGCGDHFGLPNTAAYFCDGTCLKRRGERYSNSVRIVEVSRTCIQPQRSDGCFDTTWNGISVYACACNTDYCNAANPTRSSLGGVLLRLLLATAVWLIQATVRV